MTRLPVQQQALVLYQNLTGRAWVEAERLSFDRAHARLVECGCHLPDLASAWVFVDRMELEKASELNLLASDGEFSENEGDPFGDEGEAMSEEMATELYETYMTHEAAKNKQPWQGYDTGVYYDFQYYGGDQWNRSVAGAPWLERYLNVTAELGYKPQFLGGRESFKFGASKIFDSKCSVVIAFQMGDYVLQVRTAIVEGDVPLLLSKPTLGAMGMIYDVARNRANFTSLELCFFALSATETGHPAILFVPVQAFAGLPQDWEANGPEIKISKRGAAYMGVWEAHVTSLGISGDPHHHEAMSSALEHNQRLVDINNYRQENNIELPGKPTKGWIMRMLRTATAGADKDVMTFGRYKHWESQAVPQGYRDWAEREVAVNNNASEDAEDYDYERLHQCGPGSEPHDPAAGRRELDSVVDGTTDLGPGIGVYNTFATTKRSEKNSVVPKPKAKTPESRGIKMGHRGDRGPGSETGDLEKGARIGGQETLNTYETYLNDSVISTEGRYDLGGDPKNHDEKYNMDGDSMNPPLRPPECAGGDPERRGDYYDENRFEMEEVYGEDENDYHICVDDHFQRDRQPVFWQLYTGNGEMVKAMEEPPDVLWMAPPHVLWDVVAKQTRRRKTAILEHPGEYSGWTTPALKNLGGNDVILYDKFTKYGGDKEATTICVKRGLWQYGNRHGITNGEHHQWTSFYLGRNIETKLHVDSHNLVGTQSATLSFGNFSGGGLWVARRNEDDDTNGGIELDTKHNLTIIDAKLPHRTMPWEGTRWCLSAYTRRSLPYISQGLRRKLVQFNFPVNDLRKHRPLHEQHQMPKKSIRRGLWRNAKRVSCLATWSILAAMSFGRELLPPPGDREQVLLFELGGRRMSYEVADNDYKFIEPLVAEDLEDNGGINLAHEAGGKVIIEGDENGDRSWRGDDTHYHRDDDRAHEAFPADVIHDDPKPTTTGAKAISFSKGSKVGVDAFSVVDSSGVRYEMLSAVDHGTGFHLVVELKGHTAQIMEKTFCELWSNTFGPPGTPAIDLETGLQAGLAKYAEWFGSKIRPSAGQAHWQLGTAEGHGGLWKEIFAKVTDEFSVTEADLHLCITAVNAAKKNVWRKDLEQKQEWKRMCLQQQEGTQKYLRETSAPATGTPARTPVRRKLDIAMENAGSIESGKKKGLSLRSFEKKKKQRQLSQQQQKQKKWTKVLPQGSESLTNWSRRRKLWKKRMLRSRRRSKTKQRGSERWKKPNVERRNSELRTPSFKYPWQLRKVRSLKPGSNGRPQNWSKASSKDVSLSRRKPVKQKPRIRMHAVAQKEHKQALSKPCNRRRTARSSCRRRWGKHWREPLNMARSKQKPDCIRWQSRNARDQKFLRSRRGLRFQQDSRRSSRRKKQFAQTRSTCHVLTSRFRLNGRRRRWYSSSGSPRSRSCSSRKSSGNSSRCVTLYATNTRTKRMSTSGITPLSRSRTTARSAARYVNSTPPSTRMQSPNEYPEIVKLSRMLHQRKQRSLRKQGKARVWKATRKTPWRCRIRPRRGEQSCLRRTVTRCRRQKWSTWRTMPLARSPVAKEKVQSGLVSHHFPQVTGRTALGEMKARKPSERSSKSTRRRSSKSTTNRSYATPSRGTSAVKELEVTHPSLPVAKKDQPQKPPVARKKYQRRQARDRTKQDRTPKAVSQANLRGNATIRYKRTRMVLRTWSRLVQQLLEKGLDQSVGRMPIVALELLVCLLLQLVFNCAKFGQTLREDCIRRTQKGAQSCSCM
ncbi:GIP [Symbiodinium necroappetens]|uniref:GIP protein n=1 Tax=Symbiodinium necroappetens TaxID=1628268 RepID=A0A812ZPK8_9DINO|nr:GIP [Symbiodinium necroappetens]